MKIEIDQSIKVEYTTGATVVGDSLGNVVILAARDKRILQQAYRTHDKPRMYLVEVFSALVALIISFSHRPEYLYIIDIEYPGKSDIIESCVIRYLAMLGYDSDKDQIRFSRIGKKSHAHLVASRKKREIVEKYSFHVKITDIVSLTEVGS